MPLPALAVLANTQKHVKKVVPGGWYTIVSGLLVVTFLILGMTGAWVGGYVTGVIGGNAKNSVTCESSGESGAGGSVGNRDISEFQGDAAKRNAQGIIDAVANRGMPEEAAVIAIATAMQESTMRLLWNPKVPGSKELAESPEAVGYDGFSVGLFQQQVHGNDYPWGTVQDAMNIEKSTNMFLDALEKKVPNWKDIPITVAAQTVQGSLYPDAYAKWEGKARELVKSLPPKKKFGSGSKSKVSTTSNTSSNSNSDSNSGGKTTKDIFDPNVTSPSGLKVPNGSEYSKDAKRGFSAVIQFWGDKLTSIGGYRQGPDAADHGSGRAIDIMIPDYKSDSGAALGTEIAQHFIDNDKGYGVSYVIWRNKIWFPAQYSNAGWNPYNGGGLYDPNNLNDTTKHMDHVHVSFFGDKGDGLVTKGGDGNSTSNSGESSGCETSGDSGNIGLAVGSGKGDDYPNKNKPTWLDVGTGGAAVDQWGFFNRECVSFAAWRMNQQMGWKPGKPYPFTKATMNGIGNAEDWGPKLAAKGYKVDNKPEVGAIAWWEGFRGIATSAAGHVAVVKEVKGNGQVVIEQYNAVPPHAYSTMTISVNEPSGYIHVADIKK